MTLTDAVGDRAQAERSAQHVPVQMSTRSNAAPWIVSGIVATGPVAASGRPPRSSPLGRNGGVRESTTRALAGRWVWTFCGANSPTTEYPALGHHHSDFGEAHAAILDDVQAVRRVALLEQDVTGAVRLRRHVGDR